MRQSFNPVSFVKERFVELFVELRKQVSSKYFWKDVAIVGIGVMLYIIGFSFLIYPQRITTGGLTGFCNLLTLSTGMGIDVWYTTINYGLLIVAFLFLDKNFFIKTLIGIGFINLAISTATRMAVPDPSIEESFKLLILADQPVVALILGSLLIGLGLGLVFSVNGSTGGTDVIVALISKYRNVSFGRIFMIVDGSIVISSYFVNVYLAVNKMPPAMALEKVVYSIIQVMLVSITLDWYIRSNRQSVQMLVFSSKHQEINDAVTRRLGRGCTMLDARGGYTGNPVKVLVIVMRRRQSVAITRVIEEIDPHAFVTIGEVQSVYGQGFDVIGKK